jgi:hypothetical protein
MMARRFLVSLMLVVAVFFMPVGAGPEVGRRVVARPDSHDPGQGSPLRLASPLSAEARGNQYTVYLPVVQNEYCPWCAVPTLLAPANGSTVDTLMPQFSWDSGDDPRATRAWLRVSRDAAFTEVAAMAYGRSWAQGVHHYRFGNIRLDPATTYWWRVQLQYPEIMAPPSPAWTFTTPAGGVVPPPPVLLAPPDGTTLTTLPVTLQWAPVEGALDYWLHWKVQGPGGSTSIPVEGTEARLSGFEPRTTYEWWVLTRNQYAVSDPSEVWTFTTP